MSEFFLFFYRTFSTQKKQKFLFPFIDPFLLFPLLFRTLQHSFFYLSLTTCVKGENVQTFIIMHNYETMLVIILGNLNIYVVKLQKSENNSAPSWVRTRALVVRWWNRFPTVKKKFFFSKCRFYIAIYRWSLVIKNFIKLVTFYEVNLMNIFIKIVFIKCVFL